MIKIEYDDNFIDMIDINTYLKIKNDNENDVIYEYLSSLYIESDEIQND